MPNSNSTVEYSTVKDVELLIVEALLKKGRVVIPDFGYLELKSFGDKQAVLFRSPESGVSLAQVTNVTDEKEERDLGILNRFITIPLKNEKIVNLPQVGVFRPVKREDGKIQLSFIPAFSLRKLLDSKEGLEEARVLDERPVSSPDGINNEVQKVEVENPINTPVNINNDIQQPVKPKNIYEVNRQEGISGSFPKDSKFSKENDDTAQEVKIVSKRPRRFSGVLLIIIILVAVLIVSVVAILTRNNSAGETVEKQEIPSSQPSVDLPSLSEKYYRHPAFWIYIYDFNSDKLNSPINISEDVSLVIPDLKREYDVDVTDTTEIQKANMWADIILRTKKELAR